MACAICARVLRICGTPLTCTAPSFSSRSSADASSISAAALIAFSRTATAARCTALPAVTVWRLAKAPKPSAVPAVSPAITSMSSGATPSTSPASCVSMVLTPWPCALAPVVMTILPDAPTRSPALSNGPRPVPST